MAAMHPTQATASPGDSHVTRFLLPLYPFPPKARMLGENLTYLADLHQMLREFLLFLLFSCPDQ